MAYTTINKPSQYFNTVLWTGNGTLARPITGVGFQPDFTWIKNRSAAEEHLWYDAVRGVSKLLRSNNTAAEATTSTTVYFNSFDSDGFTIGTETAMNASGQNIVGWNWLGANTTVSNTDGTISSTVSANTTSGFSIVTYTGNSSSSATVGHGLGVAPSMILNKCRAGANAAQAFFIYHKGLSANNMIAFNTNAQAGTGTYSSGILSTSPTSTTFGFTAGSGGVINVNESSSTYVSYCFAEVKGFSKAFSYTGNGSTDGSFVYCGFKPSFVMIKSSSNSGTEWVMHDVTRSLFNPMNDPLLANSAGTESVNASWSPVDFLSNGFKLRTTDTWLNGSGYTYIGIAFASNPFVSSKGIPACAF